VGDNPTFRITIRPLLKKNKNYEAEIVPLIMGSLTGNTIRLNKKKED